MLIVRAKDFSIIAVRVEGVMLMISSDEFAAQSTAELKQELLRLVSGRDSDSIPKKVQFYKTELAPLIAELQKRNPTPIASDQISLVQGAWLSLWSTIPFQDIFPGRIPDQSYQIFHLDGYYANMARYAPGSRIPWLKALSDRFIAYDFINGPDRFRQLKNRSVVVLGS
jgi:hypothetical protein